MSRIAPVEHSTMIVGFNDSDVKLTGTESELRAALETASRGSGFEFSIDEVYEGSGDR